MPSHIEIIRPSTTLTIRQAHGFASLRVLLLASKTLGFTLSELAERVEVCYTHVVISKTRKLKLIKEVAVHDKDTGSPEVQISILTKRIEDLARHLKTHAKDNHSRRGLLAMVAGRQAHMKYLEKKSPKRARALEKKLGLKK